MKMLWAAGAIGLAAGMRTFTAPAAVSRCRYDHGPKHGDASGLSRLLTALAAAEMVLDKVPDIPPRVQPPALAARIASGAWSTGTIAAHSGRPAPGYAVVGGLSALAGAYVFYELRRTAGHRLRVRDQWLGLAEDLLAVTLASRVCTVDSAPGRVRPLPGDAHTSEPPEGEPA